MSLIESSLKLKTFKQCSMKGHSNLSYAFSKSSFKAKMPFLPLFFPMECIISVAMMQFTSVPLPGMSRKKGLILTTRILDTSLQEVLSVDQADWSEIYYFPWIRDFGIRQITDVLSHEGADFVLKMFLTKEKQSSLITSQNLWQKITWKPGDLLAPVERVLWISNQFGMLFSNLQRVLREEACILMERFSEDKREK